MDGEMNLNLTKVKQSSLQEEITEPNESEINNTTFIESENNFMPSDEATLINRSGDKQYLSGFGEWGCGKGKEKTFNLNPVTFSQNPIPS